MTGLIVGGSIVAIVIISLLLGWDTRGGSKHYDLEI